MSAQPGAFRVVVNSGVTNPLTSPTLADGTMEMSGYLTDGFNGAHPSAYSPVRTVQSAATWERYCAICAHQRQQLIPELRGRERPCRAKCAQRCRASGGRGNQWPDAGRHGHGQSRPGRWAAKSTSARNSWRSPATVRPLLPAIYYRKSARMRWMPCSPDSLLIGGARTATSAGMVITPTATDVIVANDAADPLTGERISLVAAPGIFQNTTVQIDDVGDTATIQTPVAGTSLVAIRDGSVIQATGTGSDVRRPDLILVAPLSSLPVSPALCSLQARTLKVITPPLDAANPITRRWMRRLVRWWRCSMAPPTHLRLPPASDRPRHHCGNDNLAPDPYSDHTAVAGGCCHGRRDPVRRTHRRRQCAGAGHHRRQPGPVRPCCGEKLLRHQRRYHLCRLRRCAGKRHGDQRRSAGAAGAIQQRRSAELMARSRSRAM